MGICSFPILEEVARLLVLICCFPKSDFRSWGSCRGTCLNELIRISQSSLHDFLITNKVGSLYPITIMTKCKILIAISRPRPTG